jgi:hypothetical protein
MTYCIKCPLLEKCELLRRLGSSRWLPAMHRKIAKALVGRENIAEILHDTFDIEWRTSLKLQDVLNEARNNPPSECEACGRAKLAA